VSLPITLLDVILLGVMLISALLAMIRGFMREILSIVAWVVAAVVTILSYSRLVPLAKETFKTWPDMVVTVVVVAGVFLLTLLIVSVITVRFSDMVLDSRVGALDRTLGFLFGLARGLIIMAVAYWFFSFLVPDRGQPTWVRDAKSRLVLQNTSDWLVSMSPDLEELYTRYKKKRQENESTETPEQRGSIDGPALHASGYGRGDRRGMDRLVAGNAN